MTIVARGKLKIIFVDDEPEVLSGLRRMLREQRHEWEMAFANGGEEALEILSKDPFDVIVSDTRMPGMDGAELLVAVTRSYPNMVRIVLSGHSSRAMIYKSVGTAHQYLAKPCDKEILVDTVRRAFSLRGLLANDSLQQLVARLDTLPSLPSLFLEIDSELKSINSSLSVVGDIISKDAAMTAKILQLVNSAFFGFYSDVTSPSQAVTLLGLDTVRALICSVNVFSELKEKKIGKIAVEEMWDHFFLVGCVSREIINMECHDAKLAEMAFMAGMLHDIGKIVLFANLREKFEEAMDIAENEGISLRSAERQIFHSTHSEVGGYLLGLWGLPDTIIESVFFHHCPDDGPEKQFGIIASVHLANALVAELKPSYTVGKLSKIDNRYIDKIGKSDRLDAWRAKCQEIIERAKDD